MKKQFLKFALLTTVVAGVAVINAGADPLYRLNDDQVAIRCAPNPDITCELEWTEGTDLYAAPFTGPGSQGSPVDLADYSFPE